MGREDWRSQVRDGYRQERWSLQGPNRIVKVRAREREVADSLGGYITVGRSLLGKTPAQIERALGLPPGELIQGAAIYYFLRLPRQHEYEYDLTADYPGGLAYAPPYSDPRYPPGSRSVHQWKIKDGVEIPVSDRRRELAPGRIFPYEWLL